MTEAPEQTIDWSEHKDGYPWPNLYRVNGDHFSPSRDCMYLAYRGSVAHGLYRKPEDGGIDDIDLMGFCVGSKENYLGLKEWGSRGTKEEKSGTYDAVQYELRKAVSLLLQGNPNIMSMLWVDPQHILLDTYGSKALRGARAHFIGKHVYNAFAGYAYAQLTKMETRDPEELRLYLAVTAELKHRGIHPNHKGQTFDRPSDPTGEDIDCQAWSNEKLIQRNKSFQKKGENIGYMGEKRKRLVLENGYDSKNAACLVRLLRMCIEFLGDGVMRVDRSRIDAEELLDIKKGKWKLEEVKELANHLFDDAKSACSRSALPEGPNREAVEELLVKVIQFHVFKIDDLGYFG